MKKFFSFLKRTWWLFLLLFLVPVIVILYFYFLEFICHSIDMSAGEWSSLLGNAFGYWGTVLLGVLAFYQNEQAQENNNVLTQYERTRMSPVFSARVTNYDPILKNLIISITNCSSNIACEFKVGPIREDFFDCNGHTVSSDYYRISEQNIDDYVTPGKSVNIKFETPSVSISDGERIVFHLYFSAKDIIGLSKCTEVTIMFNNLMEASYEYAVNELD